VVPLAVFLVAILMRQVVAANTDVSWLLIAGERWLDGQRLYSDILETNPPMAVLIYVPGILIARLLGVSTETVVDGLIFTAIVLTLLVTAFILRRSSLLLERRQGMLVTVAIAVLAVLPVQAFGQREHIAVIELLPVMAVLAMRLKREAPPRWAAVMAGLGLGLALAFKPHFALPMIACSLVAALRLKSPSILFATENFVGIGVVVSYIACTVLWFPEYFVVITPLLRDVYTIGLPFSWMLAKPVVTLWVMALIGMALLRRDKTFDPALLLLVTASVGFGAVYFIQDKGWPYHSYPMMAFALLGFGYVISRRGGSASYDRSAWGAAAFTPLFAASMIWFNDSIDARPVQAAVARLGLSHPTILVISGNAGIAHPLTRGVGAVWASRQQSLIATSYDHYLRHIGSADQQRLDVLAPYVQRERDWLIDDFRNYQPSIVLVDNLTDDWGSWLRESAEPATMLKAYRFVQTVQGVDIYRRPAD
jgi:hypothetical protein